MKPYLREYDQKLTAALNAELKHGCENSEGSVYMRTAILELIRGLFEAVDEAYKTEPNTMKAAREEAQSWVALFEKYQNEEEEESE